MCLSRYRDSFTCVWAVEDEPFKPSHTPGGDFKADDSILTFTETGPRSFLYQVDIFDDVIAERSEELFVRLSATTPGEKGVVFHRNAAQFSIIDNDSN